VLGDNRGPLGSRDSRVFGPVAAASVSGRAALVVWPPLRRDAEGSLVWNVRRLRLAAARRSQPQDVRALLHRRDHEGDVVP
jgi:hypothetical protein